MQPTEGTSPSSEDLSQWLSEGETYGIEFKSEQRDHFKDRDLIEAVVCLANGAGGVLLIGVEDDGTVTGARPRHQNTHTDTLRVQAMIANKTQPAISTTVSIVNYDDRPVLVVEVPNSPCVVGTKRGSYLRRAIGADGRPTCLPYHAHEMLSHEINRGALDWARLPLDNAGTDDLDPWEFERLRRLVSAASGSADQILTGLSDQEIMNALGLTRADGRITTGALLLFGREQALSRFLPTHEAAFQVLRGHEVEVNEFFRVPLLRLSEELFTRFQARNREEELDFGLLRVPVADYSQTAFREVLANALIHRDYTCRGAIHVQWNEDQLEITSPGSFPRGITLENLLNAPPSPRSPLLADAFKRVGLVERTGRGINRVFAEQLRVGREAPDYGRSSNDHVVAVIPGGPANLAMTRWVLEQEQRIGQPIGLANLQVLTELSRERRATTIQLAHVMQRSEAETRRFLTQVVERGWIEARGEGRGRTWHLSAAVYRALNTPAGYVRTRGFEPLQQEQMILQYVEAHGKITRSQTSELCSITPEQATRLLRKLVSEGELTRIGERRWSTYTRPNPQR